MPLQIRRGTEAERAALTSVNGLVVGELLYVTDDQKLYIGNGTTPGGIVATSYNDNDAKAAAGSAITSGTHEYISFSYNSIARTVNSTLDLSDYQGTIKANSFKGSILADDGSSLGGITLVDATDASVNLDGTVKGNIIPDLNITYDIGSNLLRFKDLYLSGSTIYLGNATITANGTAIDIPAGSTIGGIDIGNVAGGVSNTDIVADDSTVLVNVSTKTFTGSLIGNVTGNLSNNTLSISNSTIVSSEIEPVGVNSDKPLYIGDDSTPNTLWLKSNNNFAILKGTTDGTNTSGLSSRISRGSLASPSVILAGDTTMYLEGQGYNGSDFSTVGVMGLAVDLTWDGTPGPGGQLPGQFGAIVLDKNSNQQVMLFDSRGVLSVPILKAASYATGSEPSSPEEGWIIFDSNTKEFKGWNGTGWAVLG